MRDRLQSCLNSPRRIWAVASVTFTQLVRMRIFWIPALFAVLFLLLQGVHYSDMFGPDVRGISELTFIKNTAVGGIRLFGLLFAVAATAILVPRDTEERILYTILGKSVPYRDYLAGKALGVLLLLGCVLALLDLMLVGVLEHRTAAIVAEQTQNMLHNGFKADELQPALETIREQGATWNLQRSLLIMFAEWCVLVSLTLLFSCFTSGSIVSMFFSYGFYLIGSSQDRLFQTLTTGSGGVSDLTLKIGDLFALIVPNFQVFAIFDAGVNGTPLPWEMVGTLWLVAVAYFVFHTAVASWIFSKKEF